MSDVEVRPSAIQGLGVFAGRSFRAADRIRRVNVVREVTAASPLREDLGERLDHCAYPDGRIVLCGAPDRHVNHSCDPNAYELFEGDGSYIVARRDIAAGEEITTDYNINISDGTAWPCRCGSRRCRGEVVGDFFRLPKERQREYRPYLANWFVERHRARIDALDRDVKNRTIVARLVGVIVAWGGPIALLSPADRLLGPPDRLMTMVLEQLVLWALLGTIAAIVVFWEKQPLASLSLRSLAWRSVGWGLLLAAAMICVVMPSLRWAVRAAGIPEFEAGMARILILPVWFRLVAAVTAGIVEDALFLGYAFNRLTLLTGSSWLAGIVTVLVVSFLHLPGWGIGPVLVYLGTVGIATGFFAWRRDLVANIVAHVTVDTMALVIVPVLSGAR